MHVIVKLDNKESPLESTNDIYRSTQSITIHFCGINDTIKLNKYD